MTKRWLIFLAFLIVFAYITGIAVASGELDAESIMRSLLKAGLPIQEMFVFTVDNDPNSLLGRPNQYVGKVTFVDARLGTITDVDCTGFAGHV